MTYVHISMKVGNELYILKPPMWRCIKGVLSHDHVRLSENYYIGTYNCKGGDDGLYNRGIIPRMECTQILDILYPKMCASILLGAATTTSGWCRRWLMLVLVLLLGLVSCNFALQVRVRGSITIRATT